MAVTKKPEDWNRDQAEEREAQLAEMIERATHSIEAAQQHMDEADRLKRYGSPEPTRRKK